MKPRALYLQDCRHDLTVLEDDFDLQPILGDDEVVAGPRADRFIVLALEEMNFNPESDVIVCAGSQFNMWMLAYALASYPCYTALFFDPHTRTFESLTHEAKNKTALPKSF